MLISELLMLYFFSVLRSGDNLIVFKRVMLLVREDPLLLDFSLEVPLMDEAIVVSFDVSMFFSYCRYKSAMFLLMLIICEKVEFGNCYLRLYISSFKTYTLVFFIPKIFRAFSLFFSIMCLCSSKKL